MPIINYNGILYSSDQPSIKYNDRGFTLGHGLFETILVRKNSATALDYHWQRLESSSLLMGIDFPFSKYELSCMINELIKRESLHNKIAGARVTVTHGESERGLLPLIRPTPNFLISVFEVNISPAPFSIFVVNTRKNEHSLTSKIKSISYLDNVLAKKEAFEHGYDEAILLNTASNIADGSMSNVYIVKNGEIFTPPIADGALPGVIRSILLEKFNTPSFVEKSFSIKELLSADEIFLTNSLMGCKAVYKVNDNLMHSNHYSNKVDAFLRYNNFI